MIAVNSILLDLHSDRMVAGKPVLTQQQKAICYFLNVSEADFAKAEARRIAAFRANPTRTERVKHEEDGQALLERIHDPAPIGDEGNDGDDLDAVYEHLILDDPNDGQDDMRLAHEALGRCLQKRDGKRSTGGGCVQLQSWVSFSASRLKQA